jgi:hypothetical protein
MRKTLAPLGGLLVLAVAAPAARAQQPYCPPTRVAPDMCGPGYYSATCGGCVFGPNYWVHPGGQPFNGFRPPVAHCGPGGPFGAGVSPNFPTHPFAHGPRDYFMAEIPEDTHGFYGYGQAGSGAFFGGVSFGFAGYTGAGAGAGFATPPAVPTAGLPPAGRPPEGLPPPSRP